MTETIPPTRNEHDETTAPTTGQARRQKMTIHKVESDIVIALDAEGKVPILAWLVGQAHTEREWPRARVIQAAEEAGLIHISPSGERNDAVLTSGRLTDLEVFRRSCMSLQGISEQHVLLVRLEDGQEVQLNAHVRYTIGVVDAQRSGSIYQFNRHIQYWVHEIDATLAPGITKEMIMTALGAAGDADHTIVQTIGTWRLLPDLNIEATILPRYVQEATQAATSFQDATRLVRERFTQMLGTYNQFDIRNAWNRTRAMLRGSFPFDFGGGGVTFVPVHYKPHLDAWARFYQLLYESRAHFKLLPITSVSECQDALHESAKDWAQQEWDDLVTTSLERISHAQARHQDPEKLERAIARIQAGLAHDVAELRSLEAEVNRALVAELRVHARPSQAKLEEAKKRLGDARLRGVFFQAGLLEPDNDAIPQPPDASLAPAPTTGRLVEE